MQRALIEARKGLGHTSPNPCVGAVVVSDQRIISTGYHKKAGTPHAEIHALRKAGDLARGATLYVTLEPCNHTGRTPPCTRAILASGIARVVVGMRDPNPLVNGGGIGFLREQGVEVTDGILESECLRLNRPFVKYITTKMPWVIMKAGVSLDGRISYQTQKSGRITGKDSLAYLHRLRDRVDAILVGSKTVKIDNPSLTTRLSGRRGKDPVRVVLDTHLSLPLDTKILHQESIAPTWIFCGNNAACLKRIQDYSGLPNVVVYPVENDVTGVDLVQVLRILAREGIVSLLVEGGGSVHGAFLRQRLVDQVMLFLAPLFAGSDGTSLIAGFEVGDAEQAVRLKHVRYRRCGDDMFVEGEVTYPVRSS